MNLILYILVFFLLGINLFCPSELSNASPLVLVAEFIGVLILSKEINVIIMRGCDKRIANKMWRVNLLFILFALLYLYLCWTPYLSEKSNIWGFDPQRYYLYASNYARGYSTEFALNYMGVVTFYEYVFRLFGVDPLIPLYLNILLVNIASCYIVRIFLTYTNITAFSFKYLPLITLLPEIIYFSVMSSREILCMTSCTIALCLFVDYISSRNFKYLYIICCVIYFVLFIRPPMAIGLVASVFVCILISSKRSLFFKFSLLACLSSVCIFLLYQYSDFLDIANAAVNVVNGEGAESDEFSYSSGSVAKLLTPNDPIQFVVFGIIRSFLYLIPKTSPLSLFTFKEAFNFGDAVLVYLTSCIFFFTLPAIAISIQNYRKLSTFGQSLLIFFMVFLFLVGAFNSTIIQDRYRVVYDLYAVILIISTIETFGVSYYNQMLRKLMVAVLILITAVSFIMLI